MGDVGLLGEAAKLVSMNETIRKIAARFLAKQTRSHVVGLLALMSLLFSSAASASIQIMHVRLVCYADKNMAQLRFSIEDAEHPPGLKTDPVDCTLVNGNTIRLRSGEEQAFGYGAGGGDPPAFFSLWINHRKVFSRKVWKPGYEESITNPPIYDSLLIEANRITICATAEGRPQRCSSQPLNLAKAPIDNIEYGPNASKQAVGHFSVIAKGVDNQRFCESYLDLIKPGIEHALRGLETSLDIDGASLRPEAGRIKDGGYSSLIDLSPGTKRRLMIWEDQTHYFDGSVIALAPPQTEAQQITSAYPLEDVEDFPKRAVPKGFTLISGGQNQLYPKVSSRYLHLVPQRVGGALYVFAYPNNHSERPTAALVKPLAEGGFVTLCAFNRTEPHY